MKVINIGSLNIDHVYQVPHFVRPGETLKCFSYKRFCGGKGCNQSVALGRAGANVWHAGMIGKDGVWLKEYLALAGVNVSLIKEIEEPTGHAVIQVNQAGENSIVIHGGANQCLTHEFVVEVLQYVEPGDFLLLQNEVNLLPDIICEAKRRKLTIAFNPAPFTESVLQFPLEYVSYFFVNRLEAEGLLGTKNVQEICKSFPAKFPHAKLILTLGADGAIFVSRETQIRVQAEKVNAVDTTGAGDTFIGYFMAQVVRNSPPEQCLKVACHAAGICVTRHGAADSIPTISEVLDNSV